MQNFISININRNEILLFSSEKKIGTFSQIIDNKDKIIILQPYLISENKVEWRSDDKIFVTDIFFKEQNSIIVESKWDITSSGIYKFKTCFVPYIEKDFNWVVPSVMYNKNKDGIGKFPKGGLEKAWSFREDRVSIPSCSILYKENKFVSISCNAAKSEKDISSVKTFYKEEKSQFEINIPYTESPYTYTDKGIASKGLKKQQSKYFKILKNNLPYVYQRIFYIDFSFDIKHYSDIYRILTEKAEKRYSDKVCDIKQFKLDNIYKLKLQHLKSLYFDKDDVKGIIMGKGNGLLQPFFNYTSGSFLCKSIEAATIFARIKDKSDSSELIRYAENIGDFFTQGALYNGLFYDMYDLKAKKWGGYFGVGIDKSLNTSVNTRCNGEVMYNYIRLYKLLKEAGIEKDNYINLVEKNIIFYVNNQLKDEYEGSFGRWWNNDGSPLNVMGTNGAYIIIEIIEYLKLFPDNKNYDDPLRKAAKYYAKLIDNEAFYADTLDADCIDKEAGVVILRAFMDLYDYFGEEYYLNYAIKTGHYILSWVWMYNVIFSKRSLCGKEGVKTTGLTSVSVAHHHLDFYGLYIAYDFLRLEKATQDNFYKTIAAKMINACLQLISSPENLLNRSNKFIGWQPEQINHTNWTYHHPLLGGKGKYHTCVAWEVVLTLGAILDIKEKFIEFE